jgi:peptidoglycan/xylan/chitin deacetylase (PgdA/CDA1 family)
MSMRNLALSLLVFTIPSTMPQLFTGSVFQSTGGTLKHKGFQMTDTRERARKFVLSAGRWTGSARLAAPYLAGLGAILMLHSVTATPHAGLGLNDHLTITPDFLDRALADMKRRGYDFVSLDELAELKTERHRRVAAITLDDAYLDNYAEALSVFEGHAAPFTIFVAPGLIEGAVQPWWEVVEQLVLMNDRLQLPSVAGGETLATGTFAEKMRAADVLTKLMTSVIVETDRQAVLDGMGGREAQTSPFMSWDQIGEIGRHPLGTIGAHTIHHYNLARLEEDAARAEMSGSADILERRLGHRPVHFAYPYGYEEAVGAREARLAREAGFRTAVTTRHGTIHAEHRDHLHALPRISLNGHYQELGYLRTMLTGFSAFANSRKRVVTL